LFLMGFSLNSARRGLRPFDALSHRGAFFAHESDGIVRLTICC